MAKIGSVIDKKYEVLKEIGHGGMSVVYLAIDSHLNKQWAIKEIKKSGKDENNEIYIHSLLTEANLMKRLDHPALPRIVDIIDDGEKIYIIMDYIEGRSLDKVLNEQGVQSQEDVLNWSKQLCGALGYLHAQNPPIIYRDMKPANVMLKPDGTVKIIDFGIAREYKEEKLKDTTVLGTKGYAPPEQYDGQTDARSDIYALGKTMHHLLTNKDPRKEAYSPVRMWNPDVSEGVELIIDKCVQPAAENRYQNCEELMYDLSHPDEMTRDFKNAQKKKLNKFILTSILALVCLISGLVCKITSVHLNKNDYEVLISSSSATSLDEKVKRCKEAIQIYPSRPEAYEKMLEAFEDEGVFTKKESDAFLAEFNKNQNFLNLKDVKIDNLYYHLGMLYFSYYTETLDGEASFSTRINKSNSFFKELNENPNVSRQFKDKDIAECYYHICSFYKKYIFNTMNVEEAAKKDYEALLDDMDQALNMVSNAGRYDQLTLNNAIFMFLYDQKDNMQQVNVSQKRILNLLDTVYDNAKKMNVNKNQSRKLQMEILDNYTDYREGILRTYKNAEERDF